MILYIKYYVIAIARVEPDRSDFCIYPNEVRAARLFVD